MQKWKRLYLCLRKYLLQSIKDNSTCGTLLLQNPITVPKLCNIVLRQNFSLEIYKLLNWNTWICKVNNDTINLVCQKEKDRLLLNRIGIITVKENCKNFTNNEITEAYPIFTKNEYLTDVIPISEIKNFKNNTTKLNFEKKRTTHKKKQNINTIYHNIRSRSYDNNKLGKFHYSVLIQIMKKQQLQK